MPKQRKIDIEVKKLNKKITNKRYYYKSNYGIENLGVETITNTKNKTVKEIRSELKNRKEQLQSIDIGLKESKAELKKLGQIRYSDNVSLKRTRAQKYQKALEKENKRREEVAKGAFQYMSEQNRNPYKTLKEFIEKSQETDIKPIKINPTGHTQQTFEEFMNKRMKLWADTKIRTSRYRENFFTALDKSDLPLEQVEKMKSLIFRLSNYQLSVLANGEELFKEVFRYKYESVAVYTEQYDELYDRIENGFLTSSE